MQNIQLDEEILKATKCKTQKMVVWVMLAVKLGLDTRLSTTIKTPWLHHTIASMSQITARRARAHISGKAQWTGALKRVADTFWAAAAAAMSIRADVSRKHQKKINKPSSRHKNKIQWNRLSRQAIKNQNWKRQKRTQAGIVHGGFANQRQRPTNVLHRQKFLGL